MPDFNYADIERRINNLETLKKRILDRCARTGKEPPQHALERINVSLEECHAEVQTHMRSTLKLLPPVMKLPEAPALSFTCLSEDDANAAMMLSEAAFSIFGISQLSLEQAHTILNKVLECWFEWVEQAYAATEAACKADRTEAQ